MLHTFAARFDVMGNLVKFLVFGASKQGLARLRLFSAAPASKADGATPNALTQRSTSGHQKAIAILHMDTKAVEKWLRTVGSGPNTRASVEEPCQMCPYPR